MTELLESVAAHEPLTLGVIRPRRSELCLRSSFEGRVDGARDACASLLRELARRRR
jgi:hypothetical protein